MVPVVTVPELNVLETGVCNDGFDDRDQVIEEIRQAEIDHGGFQIGQAVLQRATPDQHARIEFGVDVAGVGIDR